MSANNIFIRGKIQEKPGTSSRALIHPFPEKKQQKQNKTKKKKKKKKKKKTTPRSVLFLLSMQTIFNLL